MQAKRNKTPTVEMAKERLSSEWKENGMERLGFQEHKKSASFQAMSEDDYAFKINP